MLNWVYFVFTASAIVLLQGCGGGSSEESSVSFAELEDEALALIGGDLQQTPLAGMPVAGTATYNGVAAFAIGENLQLGLDNADLLSSMTLSANFDSESFTGSFDNFRRPTNAAYEGQLTITDGVIFGSIIGATATGTLGDASGTTDADLTISGFFTGANAETVAADIGGSLSGELGGPVSGFLTAAQ